MARPRIKLTPSQEAEILGRRNRGESAEAISKAMGGVVSANTIRVRWAEESGPTQIHPPRTNKPTHLREPAKPEAPQNIEEPETEIPLNADAETADRWLKRVERAADNAQANGNLAALATMGRLVATFLAHRHKTQPVKLPDPNDNPDMFAAREAARKRMHSYVDKFLTAK